MCDEMILDSVTDDCNVLHIHFNLTLNDVLCSMKFGDQEVVQTPKLCCAIQLLQA